MAQASAVTMRLLWVANWASKIGDVWFETALIWYWSLTLHRPHLLSLLGLMFTLPGLLSAVMGVFADRLRGKLLIVSSAWFQALLCVGLAAFVTNSAQVGLVLALMGFLEVFGVLRGSAINVVAGIITPEERAQFIGILHGVVSGIRLAGRLLAASSLLWLSIREIALLDGLSFVIAGALYLFLPLPWLEKRAGEQRRTVWAFFHDLAEGVHKVKRDGLSTRLLLIFFLSGPSMAVVSNDLAWRIGRNIHAPSWAYGLSIAMEMVGAMVAGMLGAKLFRRVAQRYGVSLVFLIDFVLLGLCVLAIGVFDSVWIPMLSMFVMGVLQAAQNVLAPSYVLASFPHEVIGRVASVFSTVEVGSQAVGSAVLAICASFLSVQWMFVTAGLLTLVSAPALFVRIKGGLVTSPTARNV
ncbi:MFS transporter [Alicyclobacillus mali (ex Roth et al. 2021)]|nr:MFS transporter [Alicyclobacillus mali (ex Roth et al. 2021)]